MVKGLGFRLAKPSIGIEVQYRVLNFNTEY